MDTKTTAVIAEPKNEQKTLEFAADFEKATSEPRKVSKPMHGQF